MNAHTKGPLAVGFYVPTEAFREIEEHAAVMLEGDGDLIAICGPSNDPVSIADATLYAAAPDLLDALRDAYPLAITWAAEYRVRHGLVDDHETHAGIIQKIAAAIAKAEGRQP